MGHLSDIFFGGKDKNIGNQVAFIIIYNWIPEEWIAILDNLSK